MLIVLCLVFLVLGFVYAEIVLRFLPRWTWPAWFIWSVWGIFTVVTVARFGLGRLDYTELFLLFLSALPGMIYLNWHQWQDWQTRQDKLLDEIDMQYAARKELLDETRRLNKRLNQLEERLESIFWTVIEPEKDQTK